MWRVLDRVWREIVGTKLKEGAGRWKEPHDE
jgi:hypothetical protein